MTKLYKIIVNNWGWTAPKYLYAETKEEATKIYNRFPAADSIAYAGRFTDNNAKFLLKYTNAVLHPCEVIL